MNDYFLILACLTLFLYCVLGIEFLVGLKGIPYLRDTGKWRQDDGPLVSIVIPALNEGESIEKTLRSIMALEYPNFEVIAVMTAPLTIPERYSNDGRGSIRI